jgi:hypothetical protein
VLDEFPCPCSNGEVLADGERAGGENFCELSTVHRFVAMGSSGALFQG